MCLRSAVVLEPLGWGRVMGIDMGGQLHLALVARDEALERVERGTDKDWRALARRALWNTIKETGVGGEFTTDDVKTRVERTREEKAWGPILLAAARAGFIENTGRTVKSAEVRCHARPKAVWRVARASNDQLSLAVAPAASAAPPVQP